MLSIDVQDQSQVNTENSDSNVAESITLLSNGNYVITWITGNLEPDLDFGWYWADVHAQMYNADGVKIGDELTVNTTTYHDQFSSSAIAMSDGGFIVLYQSTTYDPLTIPTQEFVVLSSSVLAQRFDSAGNRVNLLGDPLGDTGEVVLAPSGWTPVVAQDADGSFLVAWQTNVGGVAGFQLTYYDEEGDLAATTFHAAVHTDTNPAIVLLPSGAMLLYMNGAPGQGQNIYGQMFNEFGAAVGGPVLINTYTTSTQQLPQVASVDGGGFMAVWASNGQDGSSYGIYGQVFDGTGARVGVEFRVNTTTTGSQNVPDITALDNGNLAVVWQSNGQDGSSWGVYLQIIDASGNLVGGEIQIADETLGSQSQVKVTSDGDTIFVTWSGIDAEGDTNLFTRNFEITTSAPADDNANVLTGDDLANFIDGLGGHDSISGLGGHDTLTGGTGNDTLNGGDGNDVLNAGVGDWVDGGEGSDRLVLDLGTLSDPVFAGANPNGFMVTWGTTGVAATGIESVTLTTGNGNDTVNGLDGNDIINTGNGFDRVYGGGGADYINVGTGGSIVWHAANQTAGLAVEDNAVDTVVGGMGGDTIYVGLGDTADGGGQPVNVIDRVFVSFFGSATALNLDLSTGNAFATLGAAAGGTYTNFEEIGVFGSVFADSITGTAGSDRIFDLAPYDGAGGDDTFYGGGGNDFLSAGSGSNYMDGGDGNDVLYNTSFEAETVAGGLGDDTYYIQNAADNVVEAHGQGTDTIYSTVSYSLFGRAVENLIVTGAGDLNLTGNGLNNTLTGQAGNNVIDGGAGADKMTGGLGDDTYYVDHIQDNVVENHLEGTDTVISSISYSLFGRAAEVLTLTGASNLNATGNGLINTLNGNAGDNVLDGAGGADIMIGGLGNDTYYVDNLSDKVTELTGEGTDVIMASVSYSLNAKVVETLQLTGTADINASGNGSVNTLIGNSGNNILNGAGGADSLTGGLGADIFAFSLNSRADTVTDFSAAQNDSIDIHAYTAGIANAGLVSQSGANVVINLGAGNVITLQNATQADVLAHIVW